MGHATETPSFTQLCAPQGAVAACVGYSCPRNKGAWSSCALAACSHTTPVSAQVTGAPINRGGITPPAR